MSNDLSPNLSHDVPAGFTVLPWHRGFGRQVGPLFESKTGSCVTRAFRVEDHHTNGMLNAHGGMLMTFADLAWGGALEKDDSTWWVTVRLVCDFLSGARQGSWVEGRGEVVCVVDGVYTVEGRVWADDRTLLTGTGIFKLIDRRDRHGG